MTQPGPRREGQTFESCPAATGTDDGPAVCSVYPDRAHRCAQPRDDHTRRQSCHRCVCGLCWQTEPVTVTPGLIMPTRWLGPP